MTKPFLNMTNETQTAPPTVHAYDHFGDFTGARQWATYCKYCKELHWHRAREGWVEAGCKSTTPYTETGYRLQYAGLLSPAKADGLQSGIIDQSDIAEFGDPAKGWTFQNRDCPGIGLRPKIRGTLHYSPAGSTVSLTFVTVEQPIYASIISADGQESCPSAGAAEVYMMAVGGRGISGVHNGSVELIESLYQTAEKLRRELIAKLRAQESAEVRHAKQQGKRRYVTNRPLIQRLEALPNQATGIAIGVDMKEIPAQGH